MMMRYLAVFSAMTAMFLTSAASAIPTFTLLSGNDLVVNPGEEITINLAMDNPGGTSVVGVNGQLTGLLSAGATVVSGQSALFHFAQFCPDANTCFGGLDSANNPFFNPNDLASNGAFVQGVNDNLQIINAIAIQPTVQTGAMDPGLDGTALDVTITLSFANFGSHVLTIGGEFGAAGATVADPISPIELRVTVVPEPGTALLMGLGLTGLSFAGRRK